MKKAQGSINYDKLGKDLLNITKIENLNDVTSISDTFSLHSLDSSANMMAMKYDAKKLGAQLIYYFKTVNRNFQFVGFYDKKIVDLIKTLIKNQHDFNQFLDMIQIEKKDFFKTLVFVCPTAFTSNLIKFIKKTYIF